MNLYEDWPLKWHETDLYLEGRGPLHDGFTDCHSVSDRVFQDLHAAGAQVRRCYGHQNRVTGRGRSRRVKPSHHSWVEVARCDVPEALHVGVGEWLALDVSALEADGTGAFIAEAAVYERTFLHPDGPAVCGRMPFELWWYAFPRDDPEENMDDDEQIAA